LYVFILLKGKFIALSKAYEIFLLSPVVHNVISMPRILSTLSKLISGKNKDAAIALLEAINFPFIKKKKDNN